MSERASNERFPAALSSQAAPRWSHRDPVEAGNPFLSEDARHEVWEAATRVARETLVSIDHDLDQAERTGPHPDPYPVRLVALAESRFDVWARRALSIVSGPEAVEDYEAWLSRYVANWLAYVADTCPRVDVADELRARLVSRARYWASEASRASHAD